MNYPKLTHIGMFKFLLQNRQQDSHLIVGEEMAAGRQSHGHHVNVLTS